MPYPTQHACRLLDPDKFDEFRHSHDEFGDGIDVIYARRKGADSWQVQSIRLLVTEFDEPEAREWLKAHDYWSSKQEFEPATAKREASSWHPVSLDLAAPGEVIDSHGRELSITRDGFVQPQLTAFAEQQARGGPLPALKYSHRQDVDAIGVGHIHAIWWSEKAQKMRGAALCHHEGALEQIENGYNAVSLEAGPGDAYGKTLYPWVFRAAALLPPGTLPAVAGAHAIAAGKEDNMFIRRFLFMAPLMLAAADGAGGGGGTETQADDDLEGGSDMEALLRDLASQVKALAERVGKLEAGSGDEGAEGSSPEGTNPALESIRSDLSKLTARLDGMEKDIDDAEIDRELSAMQTSSNYCLTKGRREDLEAELEKCQSPAEKRALIAAVRVLAEPIDQGTRTLLSRAGGDSETPGVVLEKRSKVEADLAKQHPEKSQVEIELMATQLHPALYGEESAAR